MIQKTESSKKVADPKTTCRRREHTAYVRRKQSVPELRVEVLKPGSVKANKSGRSRNPKEAIACLRQTSHIFWCTIFETPEVLVHLIAGRGRGLPEQE
jgi:hypothetical protein